MLRRAVRIARRENSRKIDSAFGLRSWLDRLSPVLDTGSSRTAVSSCGLPRLSWRAVFSTDLSGARPLDLELAILRKAISQIEIDEALVWNARFFGHALEVLNYVFGKTHGH
jgi:hypothetical protein